MKCKCWKRKSTLLKKVQYSRSELVGTKPGEHWDYFFFYGAELATVKRDRDAIKSQAESVSKEYDRLLKEHETVQRKLNAGGGDKKGD